jgi:hypothetical protein
VNSHTQTQRYILRFSEAQAVFIFTSFLGLMKWQLGTSRLFRRSPGQIIGPELCVDQIRLRADARDPQGCHRNIRGEVLLASGGARLA